ncbi:MAG TPA: hypothetical protein VN794_18660 [Methylomirabilota bacterium]|nr:hypothetical protein [Methylomirabilota bacterium]
MKTILCLVVAVICAATAMASKHSDNVQGATFHGFAASLLLAIYFL